MKTIKNLLAFFVILLSLTFISCENEPVDFSLLNPPANPIEEPNGLPILTTKPITGITLTTATSGGTITSDGGFNVQSRGVVWSIIPHPTKADFKTNNGSGIGNFVSPITGLKPSTTYYIRAYATNENGTAYGNEISFTTTSLSGTYDLTHIVGPPNSSIDFNNDGIFSTNFYDEEPESYISNDKIILNSDFTFSLYGTDANLVNNTTWYFNDYINTGNWSITGNILTLTVTSNGPSYDLEGFSISGNTIIDHWGASATPTYINGVLTTTYLDYVNYIYTRQ